MRKIFLFIILSTLTLNAYPAPCYGTRMPQYQQYIYGFEANVHIDRNLEQDFGSIRSKQGFFLLSYGLRDWFSLDFKVGLGNVKQHPKDRDEVDYPTDFAGGYGCRLRLYEDDHIKTVLGFQHVSVHPGSIHLEDQKNMAILDDWQLSLIVSRSFDRFTHYAGIKWSRVDYMHWTGKGKEYKHRRMSDMTKDIGVVYGIDIPVTERSWINLEGQFIDGEAVSLAYYFSF